jgi:hypothetical protein
MHAAMAEVHIEDMIQYKSVSMSRTPLRIILDLLEEKKGVAHSSLVQTPKASRFSLDGSVPRKKSEKLSSD